MGIDFLIFLVSATELPRSLMSSVTLIEILESQDLYWERSRTSPEVYINRRGHGLVAWNFSTQSLTSFYTHNYVKLYEDT